MRKLFFLIAFSAAAAAQAAPPKKAEVGYQVERNGQALAEVSQKLEHDGKTYQISESWKGKGVLGLRGEAKRSSRGTVAADGLRPQHYEDQRPGRDTQKADFDPAAKKATLEQQDRLSFIWSFAFAPPSGPVTVSVADGKGVTKYTYEPKGREKLKTPAGEFDALKLVKRRDNAGDRETEIWLAADRGFVPVRVLLVEKDGTKVDTVATKIAAQ
jgi:hypothetical protein